MNLPFTEWRMQLEKAAMEDFFFSREAAARLTPSKRQNWFLYWKEGYGPQAALEEDLDIEVRS